MYVFASDLVLNAFTYRKYASSKAHSGFFRLLKHGKFDAYVKRPFKEKFSSYKHTLIVAALWYVFLKNE